MTHCISVWGSANKSLIDKLFTIQKHCIRILFGDLNKYLAKFSTAARARPLGDQVLGNEFYCKEHTKPLFHKTNILTIHNVYNYQCCLDVFKMLKNRIPMSVFNKFSLSARNWENLLILPSTNTSNFIYMGSKLWNTAVKILAIEYIQDIKIGPFKRKLKSCLLYIQNLHNSTDWCPQNFELSTGTLQSKDTHTPI